VYLPTFAAIAVEFHNTASAIQLTLTTFMVGLSAGQLVIGPLRGPLCLDDQQRPRLPLCFGA